MSDKPTTVNIILKYDAGAGPADVTVFIDLSTGPKTKRIGWVGTVDTDMKRIMGENWQDFFGSRDDWKLVNQIAEFGAIQNWANRRNVILLLSLLEARGRPPTFNEWEKQKLLRGLK